MGVLSLSKIGRLQRKVGRRRVSERECTAFAPLLQTRAESVRAGNYETSRRVLAVRATARARCRGRSPRLRVVDAVNTTQCRGEARDRSGVDDPDLWRPRSARLAGARERLRAPALVASAPRPARPAIRRACTGPRGEPAGRRSRRYAVMLPPVAVINCSLASASHCERDRRDRPRRGQRRERAGRRRLRVVVGRGADAILAAAAGHPGNTPGFGGMRRQRGHAFTRQSPPTVPGAIDVGMLVRERPSALGHSARR